MPIICIDYHHHCCGLQKIFKLITIYIYSLFLPAMSGWIFISITKATEEDVERERERGGKV